MGMEGPVQLETTTKPNSQTLYYVEVMAAKSQAASSIIRMINRIENRHKCKAVYRVHADRAPEITDDRPRQFLEDHGVTVTSTAGYDSNSNGRAERAVQFFCTKARTMLSSNIRSDKFQEKLKQLWPLVVQIANPDKPSHCLPRRAKIVWCVPLLSQVSTPDSKNYLVGLI